MGRSVRPSIDSAHLDSCHALVDTLAAEPTLVAESAAVHTSFASLAEVDNAALAEANNAALAVALVVVEAEAAHTSSVAVAAAAAAASAAYTPFAAVEAAVVVAIERRHCWQAVAASQHTSVRVAW
eukprot:CAMPEP_0197033646 /NCGR_PEP_ID=MMETSP1384-20130603/12000_1 /TAXON_ID=29189 /ORGANISM="Ammonia sp." /LENGTH=125 /DNA_ID=CAMNT_0042463487 /DNA_START=179 /DNA_END=553 /DNA_ORIENTATION=+